MELNSGNTYRKPTPLPGHNDRTARRIRQPPGRDPSDGDDETSAHRRKLIDASASGEPFLVASGGRHQKLKVLRECIGAADRC